MVVLLRRYSGCLSLLCVCRTIQFSLWFQTIPDWTPKGMMRRSLTGWFDLLGAGFYWLLS
jgi:hypothetical protein